MAFVPVKSERSLYTNGVRTQWAKRLATIHSMDECTTLLREFRASHVGVAREGHRLSNDALWIENAIEQRLAQLKAVELSDEELVSMCTTRELAADVCERWSSALAAAHDTQAIERVGIDFRRRYKPPIMPVNAWLRAERPSVQKLMLARSAQRSVTRSLEELRAERGATLVSQAGGARHAITLRFEDGETLHLECGEGEDIISAALREQVILLSQCRKGQCTTCKATCSKGERRLGPGVNVYSLPQEEQDEGMVLLCQTYPDSDLVINLPYGRDMVAMGPRVEGEELLVRILSFDRLTPMVHRLVVEHLNSSTHRPRELSFTPGQYVNILIPGTDQWRSFSMASPPRDDGHLEFLVKDIPGGLFSEQFWRSARVGLELAIQGPYGMFHVNRRSGRGRAFLAGGTGLAPVLSMLRHMQQLGDTTEARLLVVVSDGDGELCEAELVDLRSELANLHVEKLVTSSRSDPCVMDRFRRALASFEVLPDAYLCGPAGLVATAESVCRAFGLPAHQIYAERFFPTGPSRAPSDEPPPASRRG